MGFAVRREFKIPATGRVLLVADAGGVVGVEYYVELEPRAQRSLFLGEVESERFRPLVEACADALRFLGASGPAPAEVWVRGVSNTQILTRGHPTLAAANEGWMSDGIFHAGGELDLATADNRVEVTVEDWGRQFARAGGIAAH